MFKYKLEPLLSFRKREEEGKMRELALINSELVANSDEMERLKKSRQENAEKLTEISATVKEVGTLRVYDDYLKGCEMDILKALFKDEEINKRLSAKRDELVEYVRRRRSLELYRERLKERYDLNEKRKEQAELDEIGSQMSLREAI